MDKLKLNRKSASSVQRIDLVKTLISRHWDEIWGIVQQRAQTGTERKSTQVEH